MSAVLHDAARQRFEVAADGEIAHLDYRMLSDDVIDFSHTYTPSALRGRGLAAQLVETGVAYAHAHGWQVIASCSYVAAWLAKRHVRPS